MKKIAEWLEICKVHWKEIFALSFIFHLITDIFIILPIGWILGAIFGLPFDWHGH